MKEDLYYPNMKIIMMITVNIVTDIASLGNIIHKNENKREFSAISIFQNAKLYQHARGPNENHDFRGQLNHPRQPRHYR